MTRFARRLFNVEWAEVRGHMAVSAALWAGLANGPLVVCPDSDGDGIADIDDKCPTQAEDKDRFEDKDGCPDAGDDTK